MANAKKCWELIFKKMAYLFLWISSTHVCSTTFTPNLYMISLVQYILSYLDRWHDSYLKKLMIFVYKK